MVYAAALLLLLLVGAVLVLAFTSSDSSKSKGSAKDRAKILPYVKEQLSVMHSTIGMVSGALSGGAASSNDLLARLHEIKDNAYTLMDKSNNHDLYPFLNVSMFFQDIVDLCWLFFRIGQHGIALQLINEVGLSFPKDNRPEAATEMKGILMSLVHKVPLGVSLQYMNKKNNMLMRYLEEPEINSLVNELAKVLEKQTSGSPEAMAQLQAEHGTNQYFKLASGRVNSAAASELETSDLDWDFALGVEQNEGPKEEEELIKPVKVAKKAKPQKEQTVVEMLKDIEESNV